MPQGLRNEAGATLGDSSVQSALHYFLGQHIGALNAAGASASEPVVALAIASVLIKVPL